MPESSLSITFGKEFGDSAGLVDHISLELDNDKNEGKTSFEVGGMAYLKVFYNESYTYETSGGTLNKAATNLLFSVEEEYVTFANASESNLHYLPAGTVSYEWVGNDGGSPVFNGRKVTLTDNAVAVLKCSYKTKGDRLSIVFDEEGKALVFVGEGTAKASVAVSFGIEGGEDTTPIPYRIKITDYCSGDDLASVNVTITTAGSPMDGEVLEGGDTDANGEVYLGMLVPGRQYDLSMTKSGYLSSGSDQLNNDYFIA